MNMDNDNVLADDKTNYSESLQSMIDSCPLKSSMTSSDRQLAE